MPTNKKTNAKRKSSTTKKTTTSKKQAQARRAEAQRKAKRAYQIKQDIKILLTVALSVFLFVCNFKVVGKVGDFLSGLMFGVFGWPAYVAPIFICLLLLYFNANPSNRLATVKGIFSFVLFFLIQVGFELGGGLTKNLEKYSFKDIYHYSDLTRRGGGVFAGSLTFFSLDAIGKVGTILLLIVLMLVCVIVITERMLLNGIKRTTDKVVSNTRENREYRETFERERKDELEAKRKERLLAFEEHQREKAIKEQERKDRELVKKEENLARKQAREEKVLFEQNPKKPASRITNLTTVGPEPIVSTSKKPVNDEIHEIVLNNFDPANPEKGVMSNAVAGTIEEVLVDDDSSYSPQIMHTKPTVKKSTVSNQESFAKTGSNSPKGASVSVTVPIKNSNEGYVFPPIGLLTQGNSSAKGDSAAQIRQTAQKLQETLAIFGVEATVTDISQGPTVTRFELQPKLGVKVSRIKSLSDDIKLNLAAADIRIEAPIPGKAAIGIEVPNKEAQPVLLRDLIESEEFKKCTSNTTFAVGKDIAGKTIVYDIDKFPHILIAGATGSGKSVCLNTLIMSIIYKAHPDNVKFIMIDPKVVELSVYNGIPHLLLPVVTDAKKAAATLNFAVNEMMERYKKFADKGVRDIVGYNNVVEKEPASELYKKMPNIVIIVDEFADLIMTARNEVEDAICHLAQLARACGIHLILATQRPSADVITGIIKANMPSRLAFAVSSQVESRIILDMGGAEELLGKGDMLFYPKGLKKPVRLQGGFVSDEEVSAVVCFLKGQGNPGYDNNALEKINSMQTNSKSGSADDSGSAYDEMFIDAGRFIIENQKASIGNLQRKFKMGFNRAARIMDQLAEAGVVSEDEGTKARTVLMSMSDFESFIESNGL